MTAAVAAAVVAFVAAAVAAVATVAAAVTVLPKRKATPRTAKMLTQSGCSHKLQRPPRMS